MRARQGRCAVHGQRDAQRPRQRGRPDIGKTATRPFGCRTQTLPRRPRCPVPPTGTSPRPRPRSSPRSTLQRLLLQRPLLDPTYSSRTCLNSHGEFPASRVGPTASLGTAACARQELSRSAALPEECSHTSPWCQSAVSSALSEPRRPAEVTFARRRSGPRACRAAAPSRRPHTSGAEAENRPRQSCPAR